MLNWIIRYVIAREVYHQYQENRTVISELLSLENLGNLAWNIIFIIIISSLTWGFSDRNDLQLTEIQKGDTLYLQPWKSYWQDEVPVYKWTVKVDTYRPKDDPKRIDTVFHYQLTHKVDTFIQKEKITGVATGASFKDADRTYVGIIRFKQFEISEPNWKDIAFREDDKHSEEEFISLGDVRKRDTRKPETRWFPHFIAMMVAYFALKRWITSLIRLFKSKLPVYDRIPVYKRDNRYKSGQRVVRYKSVVKEYRAMTEEESSLHKKQQSSRLVFSGIALIISVGYLYMIYSS